MGRPYDKRPWRELSQFAELLIRKAHKGFKAGKYVLAFKMRLAPKRFSAFRPALFESAVMLASNMFPGSDDAVESEIWLESALLGKKLVCSN